MNYFDRLIHLQYLALIAHAVTQAFGGMELEDGLRTVPAL